MGVRVSSLASRASSLTKTKVSPTRGNVIDFKPLTKLDVTPPQAPVESRHNKDGEDLGHTDDPEFQEALRKLQTGIKTQRDQVEKHQPGFKGFNLSPNVNLGRITQGQWAELFALFKDDPHIWNAETLAKKYLVDTTLLQHVLRYNTSPIIIQTKKGASGHWQVNIVLPTTAEQTTG